MVWCWLGRTENGVSFFTVFHKKTGDFCGPKDQVLSHLPLWSLGLGVCVCGEVVGEERGGNREWVTQCPSEDRQSWTLLWAGSLSPCLLGLGHRGLWGIPCPAICPPLRALAMPWVLLEELAAKSNNHVLSTSGGVWGGHVSFVLFCFFIVRIC